MSILSSFKSKFTTLCLIVYLFPLMLIATASYDWWNVFHCLSDNYGPNVFFSALIKSTGLRADGKLDERSFWINHVSSLSIPLAIPFVYARMVAIHDLNINVWLIWCYIDWICFKFLSSFGRKFFLQRKSYKFMQVMPLTTLNWSTGGEWRSCSLCNSAF